MTTRIRRLLLIVAVVATATLASPEPAASETPGIHIEDSRFVTHDGTPFLIKGVHYGPWRPGTGPAKEYPYPANNLIAEDFQMIQALNANTVLIFDPPLRVLHLAEQYGLQVLYCVSLDWWAVGGPEHVAIQEEITRTVRRVRDSPALLGWLLGNEIPLEVLHQRGDATLIEGLRTLYDTVKAEDPNHPVSHANSVMGKHLDLSFLDFLSFNVYPTWPPEVVAHGFGPYIAQTLRPIADTKPLLVSEFGVNSIEAGHDGQARLLRESWLGLVEAKAAGGVVFEFADEWWKNYNNPVVSFPP